MPVAAMGKVRPIGVRRHHRIVPFLHKNLARKFHQRADSFPRVMPPPAMVVTPSTSACEDVCFAGEAVNAVQTGLHHTEMSPQGQGHPLSPSTGENNALEDIIDESLKFFDTDCIKDLPRSPPMNPARSPPNLPSL